jgi:aspartate ammonia-lyase
MAKKTAHRIEKDTLGEVRVPREALYGAQTQRAVENFPVSGLRQHPVLIRAMLLVKKAAAASNFELGALDRKRARAISDAVDTLRGDDSLPFAAMLRRAGVAAPKRGRRTEDDLRSVPYLVPEFYVDPQYLPHFPVDVFQAGAGTSFNMNCNEVIANLANLNLGAAAIHPNDHVNMAQSTNDTVPTAIRVAALLLLRELFPALDGLAFALDAKGEEFSGVVKSGRTHLQDAVPVTLGQEFAAYGAAVRRATDLLEASAAQLRELGIGGTAAGTGMNATPGYRYSMARHLSQLTALQLTSMPDLREAMQSQLPVAAVSSSLRNLAGELTRITNDIRLLASGPLTGLAEITLPAVQPGSSIMPGKVNPSMLECMNQVCFHVIGSDVTITHAVQAGQLELNVMMPLMGYELLFSIDILKNYLPTFVQKCIAGIGADLERTEAYYVTSPSLATVLNPIIGYDKAAVIAKESARTRTPIPQLLRDRELIDESEIERIFTPEFLTGQAEAKPKRRRPAKAARRNRSAAKRT